MRFNGCQDVTVPATMHARQFRSQLTANCGFFSQMVIVLATMRAHQFCSRLMADCGCVSQDVIVPATMPEASYGVLILEQGKIYPAMSGHNIICVSTGENLRLSTAFPRPLTAFSLTSTNLSLTFH